MKKWFICEYCGIYVAEKPKCNKCEEDGEVQPGENEKTNCEFWPE